MKRPRADRKSPESRKLEFLERAGELLARDGMFDFKLKDVADAAGVRPSLLNYHFKDAQSLFEELVAHHVRLNREQTAKAVGEALSPSDALDAWLDSTLDRIGDRPVAQATLLQLYVRARYSPSLGKLQDERFELGVRRVREILEAGAKAGEFRLAMPIGEAAETLHSLLTGMLLKKSTQTRETLDLAFMRRLLRRTARVLTGRPA